MSLVSKLVVHSIIGAPSTDQIDYALNYRRTEAAFVLVDFGPNAPLRLRRWLRVKVSGQGPPKPSPAALAQRSSRQTPALLAAHVHRLGCTVHEVGSAGGGGRLECSFRMLLVCIVWGVPYMK